MEFSLRGPKEHAMLFYRRFGQIQDHLRLLLELADKSFYRLYR